MAILTHLDLYRQNLLTCLEQLRFFLKKFYSQPCIHILYIVADLADFLIRSWCNLRSDVLGSCTFTGISSSAALSRPVLRVPPSGLENLTVHIVMMSHRELTPQNDRSVIRQLC